MLTATRTLNIAPDALSSGIIASLAKSDADRLDEVHNRLRRINTVLGTIIYLPGIGDEVADLVMAAFELVDCTVALSAPKEGMVQ